MCQGTMRQDMPFGPKQTTGISGHYSKAWIIAPQLGAELVEAREVVGKQVEDREGVGRGPEGSGQVWEVWEGSGRSWESAEEAGKHGKVTLHYSQSNWETHLVLQVDKTMQDHPYVNEEECEQAAQEQMKRNHMMVCCTVPHAKPLTETFSSPIQWGHSWKARLTIATRSLKQLQASCLLLSICVHDTSKWHQLHVSCSNPFHVAQSVPHVIRTANCCPCS